MSDYPEVHMIAGSNPPDNNEYVLKSDYAALIARVQSSERWAKLWKKAAKYKRNVIKLHKIMDTRIAELRMERDAAYEDSRMMQERLQRVIDEQKHHITIAENMVKRIAELERIIAVNEYVTPPNDIGDNYTSELAVKCAELERENAELHDKRMQFGSEELDYIAEQAKREGYNLAREIVREQFDGTELRTFDEAIAAQKADKE